MPQSLSRNETTQLGEARLYQILVRELHDFVVFLMNIDGCITSWNPAVGRVLGYTEEEWLGHSVDIVFTPEDRAQGAARAEITTAEREGRAPYSRWHLRKNGERFHAEGALIALRDEAGNLLGFSKVMREITGPVEAVSGSTRDTTDQKRFEKQLARSEERLKQVLAQAPVAIVVFRGRDFIVELANPFYEALLQGRHLIGRRFAELVPELPRDIWDALNRVFDFGEPFIANELYIPYDQDGDGSPEDHWFNVVYHPLREPANEKVSGVVAVSHEVTAQVVARKELERVNRELEEFAYVASHDLQEPLRMVSIYSQLILRDCEGGSARRAQYAEFVRKGVTRMEALIRDLLTYSRTVHRNVIPVGAANLSSALTEALAILKNSIEASGALIIAPPLPLVRGETQQLSHVFQNLISNSLKYRQESVVPEILVSATSDGDQVIVAVQDNGIGFEQQYAEQIFGLFHRLHRDEYAGTGLGLAICHRIIERYGGRIWAEGRPGKGATFFFSLPHLQEE